MADPIAHRERLVAPWWLWLAGPAAGAVAGAELTLGAPGLRPVAIIGGAALAALGVALLGRIKVHVRADELRVDDARLPLRFVGGATVVDPEERRRLLGTESHPLAFVVLRPWIKGTVRIDLDDPADPTPYWLVSSRRPAALVAALLDRRAVSR